MIFGHDIELALRAAVVLANSAEPPDTMTKPADLDAFFEEFGYSGSRQRPAAELESVRAIRADLRALLTARREEAAALVNEWLRAAGAVPQLVRHDDQDWHVHAVAAEAPLPTRILVETAMAMIDVIRADEMSRLSLCADDACEALVLDLSRNRSRRFCSLTCGNRSAQSAYRARQRP